MAVKSSRSRVINRKGKAQRQQEAQPQEAQPQEAQPQEAQPQEDDDNLIESSDALLFFGVEDESESDSTIKEQAMEQEKVTDETFKNLINSRSVMLNPEQELRKMSVPEPEPKLRAERNKNQNKSRRYKLNTEPVEIKARVFSGFNTVPV